MAKLLQAFHHWSFQAYYYLAEVFFRRLKCEKNNDKEWTANVKLWQKLNAQGHMELKMQ